MSRAGRLGLVLVGALAYTQGARALELPCRHEDVLAETAANLLMRGGALDPAQLLPEARSLGFDGVALHAHEGYDDDALRKWIVGQSERADGPLVCGEASSESRRLIVVAARGGELRREADVVRGRLSPGFHAPHLVVEMEDGSLQRVDVGVQRLAEGVRLPGAVREHPGAASARRVQLVAEGPHGPRPVAELFLTREALPIARPSAVSGPGAPPRGERKRPIEALLARLDGFRHAEGVGSLRPNQALSQSAQRHATRVCELGKVGHRVEGGDDPETRLRAERISARMVGEAVARSDSADAALTAVFESPSHRLAVLDRRFTDAGFGQAVDDKGHTCLVVLLASWPRRLP